MLLVHISRLLHLNRMHSLKGGYAQIIMPILTSCYVRTAKSVTLYFAATVVRLFFSTATLRVVHQLKRC